MREQAETFGRTMRCGRQSVGGGRTAHPLRNQSYRSCGGD
ncbi:hypothetical protein SHJG_1019 [Streptomyces hygroscopicus subsp. jinggangensis 5008]|nr:hypothetical protein SHJG_1019 [Streptomyces hygroscopicus subsp. jinggangensis 5008]AGF60518.1 hypothetical protein SHJGH_0852 [Streptomyces hygroscopicus subsp. jinggangensis TL01]